MPQGSGPGARATPSSSRAARPASASRRRCTSPGAGFRVYATVRDLDQRQEVLERPPPSAAWSFEVVQLDLTDRRASSRRSRRSSRRRAAIFGARQQRRHRPARLPRGLHRRGDPAAVRDERRRHDRGDEGGAAAHARGRPRADRHDHLRRRPDLGVRRDAVLRHQVRAGGARRRRSRRRSAPFGIQSVLVEPGIIKTDALVAASRRPPPGPSDPSQPVLRAVPRERGDRRQARRALADAPRGRGATIAKALTARTRGCATSSAGAPS